MGGRFKLLGRVMDGTKVNGYWLLDEFCNQCGYMQKQRVDQLALNKLIQNCQAQSYQGVVTLKGIGFKVQKLPKYNMYGERVDLLEKTSQSTSRQKLVEPEYKLLYKVMNSKLNTGFFVLDLRTGNRVFLTRDEVIELAAQGRIKDVKANRSKDKYILRGTNQQIEDLPVIQPNSVRTYGVQQYKY